MMQKHSRFLLLLAVFVLVAGLRVWQIPVMEGSDEELHYNYALFLHTENRLPPRDAYKTNGIAQETGQPPLAYWFAALAFKLGEVPLADGPAVKAHLESVRNTWLYPHNRQNRDDNLVAYDHGYAEEAFGQPALVESVRLVRLVGVAWGALAVAAMYGAALTLFRQPTWALVAAALFAFTPTMLHMTATITNDTAATALGALITWQALRVLRSGQGWMLLGAVLGLGTLAKVSVLLLAPAVGLLILIDAYQRRSGWKVVLWHGVLVGLPVLLLAGPWVLYGTLSYQDPFGFNTHDHDFFSSEMRPLTEVIRQLPKIYNSYWGSFSLVWLRPATYQILSSIVVLALAGYGLTAVRRNKEGLAWPAALFLLGIVLVSLVGLVRWMQQLDFVQGRLIYTAHAAVMLLVTGGLRALSAVLAHKLRAWRLWVPRYAVGLVMGVGILATPVALYEAYHPPLPLPNDQLPDLQGGVIDFDQTLRFLGYTQASQLLQNDPHPVTLCWEVLQPATRQAAFSLKFVHEGAIVADRTSTLGLGRYPAVSWQEGHVFCDDVVVPLDDRDDRDDLEPQPGQVYDMLLVLLDAETLAVDWQATTPEGDPIEFAIIGQVASPAGDLSAELTSELTPTTIQLADLARLAGYDLTGTLVPGARVQLALLWDVIGTTPDDWNLFIHLTSADDNRVLVDSVPRNGHYPTWAWQPGEKIAETWTLDIPSDLAAGDYELKLGLYRSETGERMPATLDGAAVPDNTAPLVSLQMAD